MVVSNDLALAVSTPGEELTSDGANQNAATVRVAVEGTPRDLHPILRDEVYRVAGEALSNAFRHAHARRIEVEIHYEEKQLRLRVRDDGKGIWESKGRRDTTDCVGCASEPNLWAGWRCSANADSLSCCDNRGLSI